LDECQQNEILEAFQQIDVDGDGVIGVRDLQRSLRKFGYTFDEEEIEDFVREMYVDVEADGTIDAVEFSVLIAALTQRLMLDHAEAMERVEDEERRSMKKEQDELALSAKQKPTAQRVLDARVQTQKMREKLRRRLMQIRSDEVKQTYDEFDSNSKGFISFEDVLRCGKKTGEEWGFEELNEMMDFAVGRGLQRRIDAELFETIIRKVPMEWTTGRPLITENLSGKQSYMSALKSRVKETWSKKNCMIM